MRSALTLLLAVTAGTTVIAQLPRDLGGLLRKMPSLEEYVSGTPPLSTGFDDAIGQSPILDRKDAHKAQPLRSLPRTRTGGFVLKPGLWEGVLQSYCLRPATYAPGKGEGYLYAPTKGSRAGAIRTILSASVAHPEIAQTDIQMLLWAILSRSKIATMPAKMQATAHALLSASDIRAIDLDALGLINAAERTRLFGGLPAPVTRTLTVEANLRDRFTRTTVTYDEVERIAVLSGVAPENDSRRIRRGQWSRHPAGYYIRYDPDGFLQTRVQVLVPDRVVVTRDRLNRITSIEDRRGGRTETVYNDTVPARTAPGDPGLKAYAFKTIRFVRRGSGGKPEVLEFQGQGWTFHRSKPRARQAASASGLGVMAAIRSTGRSMLELLQEGSFDRWSERAEQARDIHDRYEFYRDRAGHATGDPGADSVDELEDRDHYRDGVDAATRGDLGDRLDWIIDHQERENAALEHATSILDGLPTTSTTDDSVFDPPSGLAVPSGGGQRLGISGRFR
ncbi:MAG: hypothetical protein ABI665_11550 [Vicinamibacterales bacterium]